MTIFFMDESSLNPVPPGVRAQFYPLGAAIVPANAVATGTIGVGGMITVGLATGQFFTVNLQGVQIPANISQVFETNADGSPLTMTIESYSSQTLSAAGYAIAMRDQYPRKWLDGPTPVADAIFASLAAPLGDIDTEGQILRTSMRFESAVGNYLDSWQRDFFGNVVPRLQGETDTLYSARLLIFTSRVRNTLAVIQSVVTTYLASSSNLPYMITTLAEDISGGEDTAGMEDATTAVTTVGTSNNLGEDTKGAEDTMFGGEDNAAQATSKAKIIVFDRQSDPVSSAALGLTPGQFAIYFFFDGYNNPPRATPPYDTNVAALVNVVKPCGSPPVWATNKP